MGRATAHLFADEGARVAVVDRDARGVRARGRGDREGGRHRPRASARRRRHGADRRARARGARAARSGRHPVNNAGIVAGGPIDAADYAAQWERTLAINLSAHVHLIRACLDQLTRNGDGRIVNIASTEGLGASAFNSPYTASKHGVVGLTRALAVELGAKGVTVNCICPGPIHTGMTQVIPDDAKAKFARRRVPLRRYGDPKRWRRSRSRSCCPRRRT
jgi:3-oxoacyl-[acyl-carrier protein] reductase